MGAIFTLALVDASAVQVAEVLRNRLAQRRKDLLNEGPCIGHSKYDRYEVRCGFLSGNGHRRSEAISLHLRSIEKHDLQAIDKDRHLSVLSKIKITVSIDFSEDKCA